MHELKRPGARTGGAQFLAHVVFDGLDVMIDARFDLLDGRRGERTGFARQLLGAAAHGRGDEGKRQLRNAGAQVQQPLRFDADALADESRLGQERSQGLGRRPVAAVYR